MNQDQVQYAPVTPLENQLEAHTHTQTGEKKQEEERKSDKIARVLKDKETPLMVHSYTLHVDHVGEGSVVVCFVM